MQEHTTALQQLADGAELRSLPALALAVARLTFVSISERAQERPHAQINNHLAKKARSSAARISLVLRLPEAQQHPPADFVRGAEMRYHPLRALQEFHMEKHPLIAHLVEMQLNTGKLGSTNKFAAQAKSCIYHLDGLSQFADLSAALNRWTDRPGACELDTDDHAPASDVPLVEELLQKHALEAFRAKGTLGAVHSLEIPEQSSSPLLGLLEPASLSCTDGRIRGDITEVGETSGMQYHGLLAREDGSREVFFTPVHWQPVALKTLRTQSISLVPGGADSADIACSVYPVMQSTQQGKVTLLESSTGTELMLLRSSDVSKVRTWTRSVEHEVAWQGIAEYHNPQAAHDVLQLLVKLSAFPDSLQKLHPTTPAQIEVLQWCAERGLVVQCSSWGWQLSRDGVAHIVGGLCVSTPRCPEIQSWGGQANKVGRVFQAVGALSIL